MKSYKPKPELFSLNSQRLFTFENMNPNNRPTFTLQQNQVPNDHKMIIHEISMKNQALKGHNLEKQPKISHPNYLTFCQKYTQMLCHKYSPQPSPQPIPVNRNQENYKPTIYNQQLQQKISLNLIAYKRYFQAVQFDFDKDYEHLMLKIKYLTRMLQARNSAFAEKDQEVDEELLIMELFMNKINMKNHKESGKVPGYFVTPFTVFVEDLKRGRTPERENRKKRGQSSLNYDRKDFIKGENKQGSLKKAKTRSFKVTPNSPQILLHSFNQQCNKSKRHKSALGQDDDSNQMFVSFNQQQTNPYHNHNYPHQAGHKIIKTKTKNNYKNFEESQHMGDTLKYSESEMMGNELNTNLATISVDMQQSSVQETDLNGHDTPFSPVQPYRLHKLYNEANLNKLNQVNTENTHKTDYLQQQIFISKENQSLFIQKENQALFIQKPNQPHFIQKENQAFLKQVIGQIYNSLNTSIDPLKNTAQKLALTLTQTLTDVSQIITQSQIVIKQEKIFMRQDWDDVFKFISKDIQQLQRGLVMNKQQNDMKDKKFLQNLEIVQNELIQQIFQQKESRKAEENVLTQVLTNLVENLEN